MLIFQVGLPAKSSASGAMIVVVPDLMGICLWSPALDETGNSVRGVAFCKVRSTVDDQTSMIVAGNGRNIQFP